DGSGANHRMMADFGSAQNGRVFSYKAIFADFHRRAVIHRISPFRHAAPDCGMRDDVGAGTDIRAFADLQAALPIDEREGADPDVFADVGVSDDPAMRIITGAVKRLSSLEPMPKMSKRRGHVLSTTGPSPSDRFPTRSAERSSIAFWRPRRPPID